MIDPRRGAALSLLADLGDDPPPVRWRWGIVRVEPTGRLTLPAEARAALGVGAEHEVTVQAFCRGVTLLLRPSGVGSAVLVDGRGRLLLPMWLRRATRPSGSALVAARTGDEPVVVVAPTGVLDGLADVLVGERR